MDEASEAEEGRVRGGRQLSEEARVNAIVLLAWYANRTHLPYGAIANIARELLCSPRAVRKIWMRLLDGEKPLDIVKSKKTAMPMLIAMTLMISSKKFVHFLLIIVGPYVISAII